MIEVTTTMAMNDCRRRHTSMHFVSVRSRAGEGKRLREDIRKELQEESGRMVGLRSMTSMSNTVSTVFTVSRRAGPRGETGW